MRFFALWFILSLSLSAFAGPDELFKWGDEQRIVQKMNMKDAARQKQQQQAGPDFEGEFSHKSVGKAVLMSAVIPGAGQFYAESYIKSAVFLAVEGAAWYINFHYNNKGDDKDAEFKGYANTHWSEYRYWSWIAYRAAELGVSGAPLSEEDFIMENPNPGQTWYLIPQEDYTPELVRQLRNIEKNNFSHRLPKTKTQQYYEMIGKYSHQFGAAWDDATFKEYDVNEISPRFDQYRTMRDDANRLYNIAQYGLMTALVNHVVSAIDAGFTTRNYNRDHLYMDMSYNNILYKTEYVNMFGLNLHW
ncbi:MAG: hypothetical protein WAN36_02495 [Calditrichia bacterium]